MRTQVLTSASFIALIAVLGTPRAQAAPGELTAGPMVGATGATTTRVWARSEGGEILTLRVRPAGREGAEWQVGTARFVAERDHCAVVESTGLEPSTSYEYELLVDGDPVAGGPWTFRTLPKPGTGVVTIAFGSCLHPGRFPDSPIFAAIANQQPSAFVFLGDNCYYQREDTSEPAKLWARMRESRSLASLRPLLSSTPNFAQWDDHDYGPNNSDRTYPLKKVTRDIFRAYWPAPSYGEQDEGIYTRAVLGPVELFLLDARYFRDPNSQPSGPDKVILGNRQRDWLIRGLAESEAPIKVVATAGQFLARYHFFESWQLAQHERDAIVKAIKAQQIPGVVFISGDRHLAEVVRWPAEEAGYVLRDVTTSPLANRTFAAGDKFTNKEREFIYTAGFNFGWIEVDAAQRRVTLELRDVTGKTLWSVSPTDLFPKASQPAQPPDEKPSEGKRYF